MLFKDNARYIYYCISSRVGHLNVNKTCQSKETNKQTKNKQTNKQKTMQNAATFHPMKFHSLKSSYMLLIICYTHSALTQVLDARFHDLVVHSQCLTC